MKITFFIAFISLISGCTSINTSGMQASSDYENDMRSVYVIFDDFIRKNDDIWELNPDIATSAEGILMKIGAQGEALWPKMLNCV